MKARRMQPTRWGLFVFAALWLFVIVPISALAAPYAAYVMDARTGEVLHEQNAETRLHPASLTKMMTLYIAFEAVERGEISLDTKVRISKNAAAEPPSKLGLKAGQNIALRYLIRAAAVKSANDAATAIGEALEGSEAAFARRMNRTAKALGMTRTTFKNANGLTEAGHLSTARDMSILGRHVLYDYPQYYNLFSRTSTDAGVTNVANTNRRLLAAYRGADGIKTGYTRAAGFNLVASAQRGNERIIATVFGGKSTASRNAKVAELLDLGFRRAPSKAPLKKPAAPNYSELVADAGAEGKTIRLSGQVTSSKRPHLRPDNAELVAAVQATDVDNTVAKTDIQTALIVAQVSNTPGAAATLLTNVSARPALRPAELTDPTQAAIEAVVTAEVVDDTPQIVTRLSTSGGRHWGVNVGRYPSRHQAERVLLTTALAVLAPLVGSLRKVVQGSTGFDANFLGMTRDGADLACRRLAARNITCLMIGPS